MTYPDTPGYQAHSETSKEAADKLNAGTLRSEILDRIEIGGYFGRTADELSIQFDTPQSTIGARLRELELADQVIKTKMKRKTRYDRNAFVYVHPDHFKPLMGRATVKKAQNYDIIRLEAEHGRMLDALRVNAQRFCVENPDWMMVEEKGCIFNQRRPRYLEYYEVPEYEAAQKQPHSA